MSARAVFICDLEPPKWGHSRKLWRVGAEFLVTSAANAPGPETYVFAADPVGRIMDYAEKPGSFKGAFDHDKAIAGYIEAVS